MHNDENNQASEPKSLKTCSKKTIRLESTHTRWFSMKAEANSGTTFSEDTQMRVGKQL
jgi:hypothetical protein